MKKVLYAVFLATMITGCNMQETEVVVCGTLHGFHKHNPNYTYDTLFKFIDEFKPDIIGIEVRPEDMGRSNVELSKYYPYEMIEIPVRYPNIQVCGIDWWNTDFEGIEVNDSLIEILPNILWETVFENNIALNQCFK